MVDADSSTKPTQREGEGYDLLVKAMQDVIAREAEQTELEYSPSGHIVIYWQET